MATAGVSTEADAGLGLGTGAASRGVRAFLIIWSGQLVSLVGSGLTAFALGIWVYQRTGSVTRFAFIAAFATLPTVLLSPLAGALVDRWDRRWTMILSDGIAALGTLTVVTLLSLDRLAIWHIYVAVGLGAAAAAFQWPAYSAATTLLVPKQHLARAAGLVQLARAGAQILSPLVAGVLVVSIGLEGILAIDLATFGIAALALLAVRIPRPPAAGEKTVTSLGEEIRTGLRYLGARPGLLLLLGFFCLVNLFGSQSLALAVPTILAFAPPDALGLTVAVGASGLLLGGLLMGVWGGPQRQVYGVVGSGLLLGLGLVLAGLRPSLPLIAAGLFVFSFASAVVNSSSQAIWQRKVPPALQGRIFAIRRMFATFTTPVGYLLAGPLADRVFAPLVAPAGPLAGRLDWLIGSGPGRGFGLYYLTLGVALLVIASVGLFSRRLMRVEEELPDAV